MKTLVASPFEDDAVSILEWAYGDVARQFYYACVGSGHRAGQAFMNTLGEFDPDEYYRLSGSLVDPFYQDRLLPEAIDKLTSK